jgi:tight adherence protein B
MLVLFLVASISAVLAYKVMWALLEHRDAAITVRRLAARGPDVDFDRADGSSKRPRLIEVAGDVRGRFAARVLRRLNLQGAAGRLLDTAGLKWGPSGLLHRSVTVFLVAFAIFTLPTANQYPLIALAVSGAAASLPFLYVRRKATKTVHLFEEQFPDCLEFISRSMRAGHAFSVAIEMAHREFSDPLASELRRAFEEQNLGQPLDIVLRKLGTRIPSMDIQFFISAVLLQKRTGGNLAELLDKLAQLIRERFKLRARIRVVSAQGLMSGRILSAIPMGVAVIMFIVNPSYARFFITDPVGHELLAAAFGLQVMGYLIIRKIVHFEV